MKHMNKLLKVVMIVSLAISFASFGIAVIGGLVDSSTLILFWYLGLAGLLAILMASVVASVVSLIDSGGKLFQQYFYQLKGHRHYPSHAVT